MNDSQQEGFYEPAIETVTQCISKSQTHRKHPHLLTLKLRPPLCVHYQLTLFQYPEEMDSIYSIQDQKQTSKNPQVAAGVMSKKEDALPLNEYFPRNYQCLYNKFREKLPFKRDLTRNRQKIQSSFEMQHDKSATNNSILSIPHKKLPMEGIQPFLRIFSVGTCTLCLRKEDNRFITYSCRMMSILMAIIFGSFSMSGHQPVKNAPSSSLIYPNQSVSKMKHAFSLIPKKIGFLGGNSQFYRCDSQQNYWSLQFKYDFEQGSDVYFSLILPYSYSKAIKFLKCMGSNNTALKSPLGNAIPIIRIEKQHRRCKRLVLISARQHPSETVGSFVCESIIRILCSKNRLSDQLLQRLRFIVIPMVNVDGVIHGNSRTNLLGYDLNRCWDRAGIIQAKECEQVWKYIQAIQSQGPMVWSFDLHGHSREHGFFAYFSQKSQKSLIMTHYLAKNKMFRSNKCAYQVGLSKKQSIRGQLYQRKKIKNAITIQISLFGAYSQDQHFVHYTSSHFDEIAHSILQSLLETQRLSQKKLLKQQNWQQIIQKMGQSQQNDKETDSDSDPEGDYLKDQQRKQVQQMLIQRKLQRKQKSAQNNRMDSAQHKRFQTQIGQKCSSQRDSPVLTKLPFKIHVKKNEKTKRSQQKPRSKSKKNQMFNITFTNRFHSSSKIFIQSQQFYSQPKITKICYEDKQTQFRLGPARFQPQHLQQSQNLKKSLDMRRRIKMAFQRKHKTHRATHNSNLIGQPHVTKIQTIMYPTLKEKDMLDIHNKDIHRNLKLKRQLTKQLRNQSYGISMISNRFQNSFYLKSRNP